MINTLDYSEVIENQEEKLINLYKNAFPAVARFVKNMGGQYEEAKDVFQDAIIVFYEKGLHAGHPSPVNEKAYLLGIAKYIWIKKFKKEIAVFQSLPSEALEIMEDEYKEPSTSKIMQLLEGVGQKCMDLLQSFYYEKLPLSVIAGKFGFSGVRSATVQKFKCLEKAREKAKENSFTYESFLN